VPARTAAGNLAVYRRWAPVYDKLFGRPSAASRRRTLELLGLRPGERVVLPGVGTGLDLPLLPHGVSAAGVDISPQMLARARARLPVPGRDIELVQADAVQFLSKHPGAFDAAVLDLVLSVVPDGRACLHAAVAALRAGGRAVVFDKFAPEGRVRAARRAVNLVASRLGTDVNRQFEPMLAGSPARVVHDEPALYGLYRIILLERTG
jgi:phosphatidylethanolamine/phosphatidyl-N-methylethanolamine N-methyltransferase